MDGEACMRARLIWCGIIMYNMYPASVYFDMRRVTSTPSYLLHAPTWTASHTMSRPHCLVYSPSLLQHVYGGYAAARAITCTRPG